jgi:hypothetical protein
VTAGTVCEIVLPKDRIQSLGGQFVDVVAGGRPQTKKLESKFGPTSRTSEATPNR